MNEVEVRRNDQVVSYIPDAAQGLVQWADSATAAYELAKRLVTTAFAPAQYRGKPEEAAAAMLAGAEVGLSPMASLRAFDVIQGVAAPRAITLRAILQSMGHQLDYSVMTPTRVVVRGLRRGDSAWQTVEWTIKRAQELGLTNKDQWKKQPQTMLVARATSEIARLIAADAILGIGYSVEELFDAEPESTVTVSRVPTATSRVSRKRPDPVVAEPEFDTPEPVTEPELEPEPDDAPEPVELIRDAQSKKMFALFKEKGFIDRDDRLAYVQGVIQSDVASSKDLTVAQASQVIDALDKLDA